MSKISKTKQQWREQLSDLEYNVTRGKKTEPPFTGAYHNCKTAGVYRCMCCAQNLFASEHKFDSGTGWPSYTRALSTGAVRTETDSSLGMRRTEVLCASCDAHLGHMFEDGPPAAGGLRYCINSASLSLAPAGGNQTGAGKS